jgi:hypothetical protein
MLPLPESTKPLRLIGNVGIFDQQTMQPLNQLADELRAISDARLLSFFRESKNVT